MQHIREATTTPYTTTMSRHFHPSSISKFSNSSQQQSPVIPGYEKWLPVGLVTINTSSWIDYSFTIHSVISKLSWWPKRVVPAWYIQNPWQKNHRVGGDFPVGADCIRKNSCVQVIHRSSHIQAGHEPTFLPASDTQHWVNNSPTSPALSAYVLINYSLATTLATMTKLQFNLRIFL